MTSHASKSYDYRTSVPRPSTSSQPIGLVPKPLHIGMTSRVRVLNGTTVTRDLIPPELVPQPNATKTFRRQLPYTCQNHHNKWNTRRSHWVRFWWVCLSPRCCWHWWQVIKRWCCLNCIRPTLTTHCLSSSVFPLHQQKRSIREELWPFTRSSRLEIRVVRWLWIVDIVSMQYRPGCVKILD